ncbi:unnamed protein product, partial [Didymodactylos carnosus]
MLFKGVTFSEAYVACKRRFGNVFQFWLGVTRVIVISGSGDVKHIFTHRHIYDQGDAFTRVFSILIPNVTISLKDLIVDNTDKLLSKWRACSSNIVRLDIVKQCQKLSLNIFGFIAFDYGLKTLDDDDDLVTNDLARALQDILDIVQQILRDPIILSKIYLQFSQRYQQSKSVIEQYCNEIKAHELTESLESIVSRKRTSLIASLLSSLSNDEQQTETKETEEGKK